MAKFSIYSKDGSTVRYKGQPKYTGSYLNVGKLEFSDISSPVPIQWEIGDYVDYYRTGLRYKLYSLPEPKKQARPREYGAAFVYSDVTLYAATKELEIAPYRDIVDSDNGIHFSSRKDFSTYEDVYGIARRIQACMDDLYPGKWRIEVFPFDGREDSEIIDKISETKEFSVNGSCIDALGQIYETWPQIGWIHTYDQEAEKDVITIGRANKRDGSNTSDVYMYGKGKGLASIKRSSANKEEFCTRLYVFGAERNVPARYYNSKAILDAESVDIPNLMIPISEWGKTKGMPDAKKAYLEADRKVIERYGVIPRTVYFDGTEFGEIYPSIEYATAGDIRAAKGVLGETENIPNRLFYQDEYRIDQIYMAVNPDDNGIYANPDGSAKGLTETFVVYIPQIGFDISKQASLTTEGKAVISVKSGMCAGREFIVKSCEFHVFEYAPTVETWKLVLQRARDESTGMVYPNGTYRIEQEDKFVILEIAMPELYISISSNRLLSQGKKILADYSRISPVYEPDVDSIHLSKGGKLLKEGMFMQMSDPDIIDTEDNVDHVLIDSIAINEDESELPIYKVTLRDSKRAAKNFGALEEMIDDADRDIKRELDKQRNYTERRFKDALETMSMLQGSLEKFTEGVSPVTVQTMMMLLGDESLQFAFTESRNSLTPVPLPLTYDPQTKTVASPEATLMHLTLGITDIKPHASRKAADYLSWNIQAFNSKILSDGNKKYYIYAKVGAPDENGAYVGAGVFFLSESVVGMNDEAGFYQLLVGILNSEQGGTRSLVPLYGFTEILPGQITTDVIRSSDGNTYFDLLQGIIRGRITFIPGTSGLENVDGYTERQGEIDAAIEKARADAVKTSAEALSSFERTVSSSLSSLQDQIDDSVTTWYEKGVPTLNNAPAASWTTESERNRHIGDLYYDKTSGYAYRFLLDRAQYEWVRISDSDVVEALRLANEAQDTADGKRTIYYSETAPTSGLSVGDMWSNGKDLKIWDGAAWVDSNTYAQQGDLLNFRNEYLDFVSNVNTQLDGMMETYYFPYEPTKTNAPASGWTAEEKNMHIGDLFFNSSTGESYIWRGAATGWAPIKDADINKALSDAQTAQDTADGKRRVFMVQPKPPYDEGDLWIKTGSDGNDMFVCTQTRTVGSFAASDWKASNDASLNVFADTMQRTINNIQNQIDGKAETWYQSTDPSLAWTSAQDKNNHIGDIWHNTSSVTINGVESGQSAIWSGTGWKVSAVPQEVFDTIDGKSAIYTSKPSSYEANDIWILEAAYTLGGTQYTKGELVTATISSSTFNASHWTKKIKYTDDTAADAAKKLAENAKSAAGDAQTAANTAITAAGNAQTAANNAMTAADNAAATLAGWAADNVISPLEKQGVKDEKRSMEAEYNDITSQAQMYGVTSGSAPAVTWKTLEGTWNSAAQSSAKDGKQMTCVSPGTSGSTKIRCSFSGVTQITFMCLSSGEMNYDYLTIGNIDTACSRTSYGTSLKGKSGTWQAVQFTCDTGEHYVEFVYSKDSSTDHAPDNATVYISAWTGPDSYKAYSDAYASYRSKLNEILSSEAENVPLPVGFDTAQRDYYAARTNILYLIASKAKAAADDATAKAQEAKETANAANAAAVTLDTKISNVETGLQEDVAEINRRLDGVVENYFYEYSPTTNNMPASGWTTEQDKKNHLGDTFTNIQEYVDAATTPDAGKSWRWTYTDSEHTGYHWHPIADSDAVKALLEASEAKAAADGKSRTFVTQPKPPYDKGDQWITGSKDLMVCITSRTSGQYTASDWELATKYTDDTKVDHLIADLDDDNLVTVGEKLGLRRRLKEINPSETSSVVLKSYSVTAREATMGNAWTEVTDKNDANYGWYVSDLHIRNGRAITTVRLNIVFKCDITVEIMSRAEGSYDYTILSPLDTELTWSGTGTFTPTNQVATTKGKQGTIVKHVFSMKPGTHFFQVAYRKDSSGDTEPDNGYYRITTSDYSTGSYGEYCKLCDEKKDTKNKQALTATANALFQYMHTTIKVWVNEVTDMRPTEGSDVGPDESTDVKPNEFRETIYNLFKAYDSVVTQIVITLPISDLDYLRNALPNGSSLIDGGVVLTNIIGVTKTEPAPEPTPDNPNPTPPAPKITAFMNGADSIEGLVDSTHGVLMFAAGIPEGTLSQQAQNAATRIYADGTLITRNANITGNITADSGTIGNFKIGSGGWLKATEDTYSNQLSAAGIDIEANDVNNITSHIRVFSYGATMTADSARVIIASRYHNKTHQVSAPIHSGLYISVESDGTYSSEVENNAIRCENGTFAGLRPQARTINGGLTLTEFDYYILCQGSSTDAQFSIQLPSTPKNGQRYEIDQTGNVKRRLYSTNKKLYVIGYQWGVTEFTLETQDYRLLRVVYVEKYGYWVVGVMPNA